MRPIAAAVTTGAALAALTGCASPHGGTEGDPAPRALTETEREVLAEAEGILTRRCMVSEGYEIFLSEPPEKGADLPYGNDDIEFAREHGLGLPEPVTDEDREDSENGRYFAGLSPQQQEGYLEALNGDPDHQVSTQVPGAGSVSASTRGCTAAAQGELYGDFEDWFTTSTRAEALPQRHRAEVVEDDRYRKAEDAWGRCMARQGHDVDSPAELRASMIEPPGEEAATTTSADDDAELAAAVAEARCGASTRLPDIGQQVEKERVEQAGEAERRLVRHYRSLSMDALERAEAIVAEVAQ
ncbi:hypothetical protein [Aeromicrobium sp. CTD01-1L150]|uniref:hypothetical protein n=1 Tax=Aeromicrobium sp. CTD01-1L150 TaxID=3341830 RepID=UPI0035C0ACDF